MRNHASFLTAMLLFAGCATMDWNSRVGHLTYDQAVTERGAPWKSAVLSDGTTVAEWLTSRGSRGSVGFGPGAVFASPGLRERRAPHVASPKSDQYLRLTFARDGKLIAWKKAYR